MTDFDEQAAGTASEERSGQVEQLPEPRGETGRTGASGQPENRIAELEGRLARLERLVWGDDEDESDLDTLDPELVRLAGAAERAHDLTRMVAAPQVRAACEHAVAAWTDWNRRYRELLDMAVVASRAIAISSADQGGRAEAVAEFAAVRAELAELLHGRQGYLNAATHASLQLAKDQEIRDSHQPEIDAGHRAWTALSARLRLRIIAAVRHGAPLPAWLVVVLGPPPPGDLDRWRELAADLLAYRLTYSVTSKVAPLGGEPDAEDSPRRRRWYGELSGQLAGWLDMT